MSLRLTCSAAGSGEALGRSRGGLGTKIVGVCDAAGRLVDFLLAPGQAHELAPSLTLLRRLPEAPSWAIADMACDAHAFRSEMRAVGAIPVVPSRRGAKQAQPCPAYIYRHRNLIERCWSRLKERRAVATRIRQDGRLLRRRDRHRGDAGLDQDLAAVSSEMRTDPNVTV